MYAHLRTSVSIYLRTTSEETQNAATVRPGGRPRPIFTAVSRPLKHVNRESAITVQNDRLVYTVARRIDIVCLSVRYQLHIELLIGSS